MALLRLAPRPPAGPTEPPALSPVRQRLADHYRRQAEQLERLDTLSAPGKEVANAEERVKQARAALDAIEQDERRELDAWMTRPQGPLPSTLNERRSAALVELATAERALDDAKRRGAASEPAFRAEEQKLHTLNKQTPDLIDAVLIEEANALADQLRSAKLRVAALIGAVKGLEHAALLAKRSAAAVGVIVAQRGGQGTLIDEQKFVQAQVDTGERHRVLALGLLDRLKSDPAASSEIDTGEPPPTESAA